MFTTNLGIHIGEVIRLLVQRQWTKSPWTRVQLKEARRQWLAQQTVIPVPASTTTYKHPTPEPFEGTLPEWPIS